MNEYEKLLDQMHFEIGSALMDNDIARKGLAGIKPQPESEILRTSRRTYVNLKIMMLRLERALYEGQTYEEDKTEISDRDTHKNDNTESGNKTTHSSRPCSFSC